jgi:hypothetical protein
MIELRLLTAEDCGLSWGGDVPPGEYVLYSRYKGEDCQVSFDEQEFPRVLEELAGALRRSMERQNGELLQEPAPVDLSAR